MLDAHNHLDRYKDPKKIACEAELRRVFTIAVTNLPSHFLAGLPHIKRFSQIQLSLGFHPLASLEMNRADMKHELTLFKKSIHLTSFVGEIGLDFSHEGKSMQVVQLANFRVIAEALSNCKKYISLHSRFAESAVLDILGESQVANAVFHWYSGSVQMLDEVVSHGHYFSVNPGMLRSEKGKKIIDRIPPERLLTETDGPYVKVNRFSLLPWDVTIVENYLSAIWAMSPESVRKLIWSNYKKLLSQLSLNGE